MEALHRRARGRTAWPCGGRTRSAGPFRRCRVGRSPTAGGGRRFTVGLLLRWQRLRGQPLSRNPRHSRGGRHGPLQHPRALAAPRKLLGDRVRGCTVRSVWAGRVLRASNRQRPCSRVTRPQKFFRAARGRLTPPTTGNCPLLAGSSSFRSPGGLEGFAPGLMQRIPTGRRFTCAQYPPPSRNHRRCKEARRLHPRATTPHETGSVRGTLPTRPAPAQAYVPPCLSRWTICQRLRRQVTSEHLHHLATSSAAQEVIVRAFAPTRFTASLTSYAATWELLVTQMPHAAARARCARRRPAPKLKDCILNQENGALVAKLHTRWAGFPHLEKQELAQQRSDPSSAGRTLRDHGPGQPLTRTRFSRAKLPTPLEAS